MSIELTSLILFAALFLVMALGVPFAFVTGGVAVVFTYLLWGSQALYLPAMQAFMASTQITLLPLPLFILMANIMERSGVAEDLYSTLHGWFGSLRGGLAVGTVGLGTIFAAMAGGLGRCEAPRRLGHAVAFAGCPTLFRQHSQHHGRAL